jgi:hypothetical protein
MDVRFLAFLAERPTERIESLPMNEDIFVIGVGRDGVNVDKFVDENADRISMVKRFPDTPNLKYATSSDGLHVLQPAFIRRIK